MNYPFIFIFTIISSLTFSQWGGDYDPKKQPPKPDYSQEKYWSALPFREDAADYLPKGETAKNDSLKPADVFYIYPTIYGSGKTWNADVDKKRLNKRIDRLPVKYQASVFNDNARVYAPRYRQAIGKVWKNPDGKNESQALEMAYQDVKSAFEYYLQNYNQGRPLIIAAHSQGSFLGKRLIQEYFDTTQDSINFVVAYLVGYGIDSTMYNRLKPCESAEQTDCYITWSSFKNKFKPENAKSKFHRLMYGNVCVNPVNWTTDKNWYKSQEGGIFLKIKTKEKNKNSASIQDSNYLWVKHKINSVRLLRNMHVLDYNLFWFDTRKNAGLRIQSYTNQTKE